MSRVVGCAALCLSQSFVATVAIAIVANRNGEVSESSLSLGLGGSSTYARTEALEHLSSEAAHRESGSAGQQFDHVTAFACHFKTGTILLRQISESAQEVLGEPVWISPENQHHKQYYSGNRLYSNFDQMDYYKLKQECNEKSIPYKIVHVIRDPIHMVISGYWYATRHPEDKELVNNWEGHTLANLNLQEGLELQGRSMMATVLKDMESVFETLVDDDNVLTMTLEDFGDDYNNTVREMYKWFLGEDHPKIDDLVEAAAMFEVKKHPDYLNQLYDRHTTSSDEFHKAMAIIKEQESASTGMWADLRHLRRKFGFGEVLPDTWRLEADWKTPPSVPDV